MLLFALVPTTAQAQHFPAFTDYVVDAAEVIPPAAEARLNRRLAALQRRTRHQLAVATVPSLEGRPILTYSVDLARRWGVGRRHYDDGVLILVAPHEQAARIEVGYGLEATLTDARCAAILRTALIAFAQRQYARGIAGATDAIIARLDAAAPLERGGRA